MPFPSNYDFSLATHHENIGRTLQRGGQGRRRQSQSALSSLGAAVQSCNDKSKGFSGDGEKRRRGIGLGAAPSASASIVVVSKV